MSHFFEVRNLDTHLQGALLETELLCYIKPDQHAAWVSVEFHVTTKGIRIHGARLYSKDNRYIGWWARYSIPHVVLSIWETQVLNGTVEVRPVFSNPNSLEHSQEHQ